MAIFVITDISNGWDCVCGVYEANTELDVIKHYFKGYGEEYDDPEQEFEDRDLIVHESSLTKIN